VATPRVLFPKHPAQGVSRRLSHAGFVRHVSGVEGYRSEGAGDGDVHIYHVDRCGNPQLAGPMLQKYGVELARQGFQVLVVDGLYLRLPGPHGGSH